MGREDAGFARPARVANSARHRCMLSRVSSYPELDHDQILQRRIDSARHCVARPFPGRRDRLIRRSPDPIAAWKCTSAQPSTTKARPSRPQRTFVPMDFKQMFTAGPLSDPQPPSTLLPAGAVTVDLTLRAATPTVCGYSVGKDLPFDQMTTFDTAAPSSSPRTIVRGLDADPGRRQRRLHPLRRGSLGFAPPAVPQPPGRQAWVPSHGEPVGFLALPLRGDGTCLSDRPLARGPLQRGTDPPVAEAQSQLLRSDGYQHRREQRRPGRVLLEGHNGPEDRGLAWRLPSEPDAARGGRVPGSLRVPENDREPPHVRRLLLRQLHDVTEAG